MNYKQTKKRYLYVEKIHSLRMRSSLQASLNKPQKQYLHVEKIHSLRVCCSVQASLNKPQVVFLNSSPIYLCQVSASDRSMTGDQFLRLFPFLIKSINHISDIRLVLHVAPVDIYVRKQHQQKKKLFAVSKQQTNENLFAVNQHNPCVCIHTEN